MRRKQAQREEAFAGSTKSATARVSMCVRGREERTRYLSLGRPYFMSVIPAKKNRNFDEREDPECLGTSSVYVTAEQCRSARGAGRGWEAGSCFLLFLEWNGSNEGTSEVDGTRRVSRSRLA